MLPLYCIFPVDSRGRAVFLRMGGKAENAEKHKMQLNLVFSGDMTYKMSENVQKTDKIIR